MWRSAWVQAAFDDDPQASEAYKAAMLPVYLTAFEALYAKYKTDATSPYICASPSGKVAHGTGSPHTCSASARPQSHGTAHPRAKCHPVIPRHIRTNNRIHVHVPPRQMHMQIPPPPSLRGNRHLAQKAQEILGAEGARENFYKALKAPKLIYTVILWYRFVVQSPPPPRGGDRHFMTVPLPLGGTGLTKRGEIARGGYTSASHARTFLRVVPLGTTLSGV